MDVHLHSAVLIFPSVIRAIEANSFISEVIFIEKMPFKRYQNTRLMFGGECGTFLRIKSSASTVYYTEY
jgi:hypothetical protein